MHIAECVCPVTPYTSMASMKKHSELIEHLSRPHDAHSTTWTIYVYITAQNWLQSIRCIRSWHDRRDCPLCIYERARQLRLFCVCIYLMHKWTNMISLRGGVLIRYVHNERFALLNSKTVHLSDSHFAMMPCMRTQCMYEHRDNMMTPDYSGNRVLIPLQSLSYIMSLRQCNMQQCLRSIFQPSYPFSSGRLLVCPSMWQ